MPLNKSQMSSVAAALEKRYASLLEDVRNELETTENQQYVELIGRVPADAGDQSVGDMLADLNLGIIDRQIAEIRDLDAARIRMAGGSFGNCIDCGTDIAVKRLLAYPSAKRCLECQQRREKAFSHEGTPKL